MGKSENRCEVVGVEARVVEVEVVLLAGLGAEVDEGVEMEQRWGEMWG